MPHERTLPVPFTLNSIIWTRKRNPSPWLTMTDPLTERLIADLTRRFGGGAAMEAAHVADKMRARGDKEGAVLWMQISVILRQQTEELPSRRDSQHWD